MFGITPNLLSAYIVLIANISYPISFKTDCDFEKPFYNGLSGIVVPRRPHNPRVVGSKPALATFENSILGQGINTNCASLHPGI